MTAWGFTPDFLVKANVCLENFEVKNGVKGMKKIIPVVIIALICIGYGIGALFFSNNFLPQTKINEMSFGGKDVEYVKQKIDKISGDVLTVLGKNDVSEEIKLSEVGYTETFDLDKIKVLKQDQNGVLWVTQIFGKKEYELIPAVEYDKIKLEKLVEQLNIISGSNVIEPKDAYIKFDNGKYELIAEVEGNKLDEAKAKKIIDEAISTGKHTVNLLETGCYIEPKVLSTSPEISDTMKKLEKLSTISIVYDFEDRKVVLTYDTIAPWLKYENNALSVDEEKVRKYIEGLAGEYDTLRTNRQFQTTESGVMTIGGGNYGWQTDIVTSTQQLIELIESGESKTIQPAYTTYGFSRKADDLGNTYVEIDLTAQKMWYYLDGQQLVATNIVSGLPNTDRETPTGVFKLLSRETKRYLTGEDYKLWVEYWLPITWAGVGIHDASWQTTFGGNRYLTHGSHGCLNTPFDKVKTIFDNIKVGTPVLVYKSAPKPVDQQVTGDTTQPNTQTPAAAAEQNGTVPNDLEDTLPEIPADPPVEVPVENPYAKQDDSVKFEYPVGNYGHIGGM